MKIKKGLIVDSSYLIHRALHVKELSELTDSKGRKTGAIYQVFRSLVYEMDKLPGYYPVFCFDYHQSPRRLELYPNYKHNQDRVVKLEEAKTNLIIAQEVIESNEYVENYHAQRAVIIEILKALGIPCLFFENWEGDDLQYICTKLIPDTIVMTDDKDLIQLLSPHTKIARPMAKELLVYEEYQKEYNDPDMKKFIYKKAITGDISDNIPSACKGCGEKAAEEIAELMATDNNWKETLENHRLKKLRNFVANENYSSLGDKTPLEQFRINMELIDLSKVPIDDYISTMVVSELESAKRPDFFKVVRMFNQYDIKELDLNALIGKISMLVDKL